MELRDFAERVLTAETLAEKLESLSGPATDERPGEAVRIVEPGRPQELRIVDRAPGMPRREAFHDPIQRGVAHHVMANHELQAVEVMAFVLLAFPEAPREFRLGLVEILGEEQRHTRMHAERAAALGVPFGSRPVNGYLWRKAVEFESVLDYVAGLPLVFEGANLDHTLELEPWFREVGDERGAAVLRTIHRDEIGHVAFGLDWLRRLKDPVRSEWETWREHLRWPLRPAKAKGTMFHREPRIAAGMGAEMLDGIEAADPAVDEREAGFTGE